MPAIKKCLFFVDSQPDDLLVARVAERAKTWKAQVTLASSVRPVPQIGSLIAKRELSQDEIRNLEVQDRQEWLEGLAKRMREGGAPVSTRVLVGNASEAIIRAVQHEGFDYVVKAPAPDGVVGSKRLGALDMRLIRACPCPVAVVRPPKKQSNRIVAAVELNADTTLQSALNQSILAHAALVARVQLDHVYVVHAWTLYGESILKSPRVAMPQAELEALLESERKSRYDQLVATINQFRSSLDGTDSQMFRPELELVKGDPTEAIPRKVEELEADILVMGTASRGGIRGFLIGNLAETLLNQVDCSVLTVKPDDFVCPIT